eukprot:TRINITY_DN2964_c0_g1_i1.p1 TRINITY_DN2964_c0_g1~~TRINITY_DN2964_c0_g1_i1.p1  ORF type:complete len:423 (-),score=82.28 TRINITY_DN2964_c0_g1_i1:211-1479(-)
MSVFKVVITGGPCAGKTSSLALIGDHFRSIGWSVYVVPEAATILLGGGVSFQDFNDDQVYSFQKSIVRMMMTLETTYEELAHIEAKKNKNCLVICDRGVMDASVYCSKEIWTRILTDLLISDVGDVRDRRYHCVVHLITAADGALEYYSTDNNVVRNETPEEAVLLDQKTLKAWFGHPALSIVDNKSNFKEKVLRVLRYICQQLGVEEPMQSIRKRKFLVKLPEGCLKVIEAEKGDKGLGGVVVVGLLGNVEHHSSECQYTFIASTDQSQQRLKKRVMDGICVFTYTTRIKTTKQGPYLEKRRNIGKREYKTLSTQKLPNLDTIKILRKSFVYLHQCFTLNIFVSPERHRGLALLEIYADDNLDLKLPPLEILQIEKEVTGDSKFSLSTLAKNPNAKLLGVGDGGSGAFSNSSENLYNSGSF